MQTVRSLGGKASAAKQRAQAVARYLAAPNICLECAEPILPKDSQKITEVRLKKFCNQSCCARYWNARKPKRARRVKQPRPARIAQLPSLTKGKLFAVRGGYQSARSAIRKHAAAVYALSKKPMACAICQYATHVDIAHIRSVASFSATATIAEINAPGNLVALCPTHHWEYDHGLCQIADPGVEPGKTSLMKADRTPVRLR